MTTPYQHSRPPLPPPDDALRHALARAVEECDDALVREWAEALLRGDEAESAPAPPPEPAAPGHGD